MFRSLHFLLPVICNGLHLAEYLLNYIWMVCYPWLFRIYRVTCPS